MANNTKRFDRELFLQNDALAREAVRKLLDDSFVLLDNPKKMGVDILVHVNGEHVCNLELECKKVWEDTFKWDTLQIPFRKKKYCELEKPTFFVLFNKSFTQNMCVSQEVLLTSEVKEVANKYVFKGELFFTVNISSVIINNLQEALNGFLTKA